MKENLIMLHPFGSLPHLIGVDDSASIFSVERNRLDFKQFVMWNK